MPEAVLHESRIPHRGAVEETIGLQAYATDLPRLGGRLRARIEDFVVDEVMAPPHHDAKGRFVWARIRLTNWETNGFVHEASDRLGMSRKRIRFSGTKDRRAVTTQWFSFQAKAEDVAALDGISGVDVLSTIRSSAEMSLGHHAANRFRVVVSGIALEAGETQRRIEAIASGVTAAGGAPNFFGPQRFGARRPTTHVVGECITRGDFVGAVAAYLGDPVHLSSPSQRAAWKQALAARDWKALLPLTQGGNTFERAMLHRLIETDGNAIAALRALPPNLQSLFVYAYQSWMFNRILSRRLTSSAAPGDPMVGDLVCPVEDHRIVEQWGPVQARNLESIRADVHARRVAVTGLLPGTEAPPADGAMGEIERSIMSDAGVEPRSFLVPEYLPWSSKGTRRALLVEARDLRWDVEAAPENSTVRAVFEFTLPPGAYATSVLREFIGSTALTDYA